MLDMDRADDTLGARAVRKILLECLAGIIYLPWRNLKIIIDFYPGDFEDTINIFNVAFHTGTVTIFGGRNIFLGQKPSQGSHHSPSHTPYDVVKGSWMFFFRLNPVKSLNSSVHTVEYRFFESFDKGFAS